MRARNRTLACRRPTSMCCMPSQLWRRSLSISICGGALPDASYSYSPALLRCSLRLPGLPGEDRADLKERVTRWQDARQADRHFRKALAPREKGDLQGAIEELSATVRRDPASADAFR